MGGLSPVGVRLGAETEQFLAGSSAAEGRPVRELRVLGSVAGLVESQLVFRDMAEQVATVSGVSSAFLLDRAAGLIVERGWVRGAWERDGGLCLTGALSAALRAHGFAWEVRKAAELSAQLVLAASTDRFHTSLIAWNDDLRRTRGEVLGLLASSAVVARVYGAPEAGGR